MGDFVQLAHMEFCDSRAPFAHRGLSRVLGDVYRVSSIDNQTQVGDFSEQEVWEAIMASSIVYTDKLIRFTEHSNGDLRARSFPLNIIPKAMVCCKAERGIIDDDRDDDNDDDDGDGEEDRLMGTAMWRWAAPHEVAARQRRAARSRVVAFSMVEGHGRTLKGRDLTNVRNAVWRSTGFFG